MRSPTATTLSVPVIAPEPEAPSDRELVRACAGGATDALGQLFDRHHGRIHRFLVRLVGRHADVDDLVQATFLEVMTAAARFRAESQVGTWLIAIAANLARQQLRARRRISLDPVELVDHRPDPRESASRRQMVDRLERELALLPHLLREAFVLCDLEQVRCIDAARLLGVPDGTLARRLHDARCRLRAAVQGGTR
jgi:RNA polymerase sigma-70 factor, ECF subfamily